MNISENAYSENENCYINEEGFLVCSKCHELREFIPDIDKNHRFHLKTPRMCRCLRDKLNAEQAELEESQRILEINRLRSTGIQNNKILQCRFENDDSPESKLSKIARRYAEKFQEIKEKNLWMYLWGDEGVGKSFYAGCIANALIENRIPVLVTSMLKIINQLFSVSDKNQFIENICSYDLIVLDDFGAENPTAHNLECIYQMINARYESGKPLIITTRINPADIAGATDPYKKRISDKISEKSFSIRLEGKKRTEQALSNIQKFQEIISGSKNTSPKQGGIK